jgi:hypothetical protein
MQVKLTLSIAGLGIIFYSPYAVEGIAEGANYLSEHFVDPKDVAAHVMAGNISAFCTGTSGDFELLIRDEGLDFSAVDAAEFKIRLGLRVRGGVVYFRDLYDLMDWTANCSLGQQIEVPDGYYRITAFTSRPASGIFGDGQQIHLYFEKVERLPELKWHGVPQLCG